MSSPHRLRQEPSDCGCYLTATRWYTHDLRGHTHLCQGPFGHSAIWRFAFCLLPFAFCLLPFAFWPCAQMMGLTYRGSSVRVSAQGKQTEGPEDARLREGGTCVALCCRAFCVGLLPGPRVAYCLLPCALFCLLLFLPCRFFAFCLCRPDALAHDRWAHLRWCVQQEKRNSEMPDSLTPTDSAPYAGSTLGTVEAKSGVGHK
jgi:hypothetical protein